MKNYHVYIVSNPARTVLYTGVTSNLEKRVYEHQHKLTDGFTKKYNCSDLVFYEQTSDVYEAITREKQIKGWSRGKKNDMIQLFNPGLKTLNSEL